MLNLSTIINENTFVIADTHLGHARILQYEPVRIKFLLEYNPDIKPKCEELLDLFSNTPIDEIRNNKSINDLCQYLIPFHDKMITEKWNSVVNKNDTVLHLGDFAFRNIKENTENLNGKKILLRGNHDRKNEGHYINCGWKEVIETIILNMNGVMFRMAPNLGKAWCGFLTSINGVNILLSHFPIYNSNDWDLRKYGHVTKTLESVYSGFGGNVNIHGHVHSLSSVYKNAINVSIEHIDFYPKKINILLEKYGYSKGKV